MHLLPVVVAMCWWGLVGSGIQQLRRYIPVWRGKRGRKLASWIISDIQEPVIMSQRWPVLFSYSRWILDSLEAKTTQREYYGFGKRQVPIFRGRLYPLAEAGGSEDVFEVQTHSLRELLCKRRAQILKFKQIVSFESGRKTLERLNY